MSWTWLTDQLVLGLHIPDGFLNGSVVSVWWVLTSICIAIAIHRSNHTVRERQIPLMGVMAAFIFAAQMLNFPVLGGTSGHLLGGALAALLLGPWTGMLVMTCVIGLQALLFQDGGLLAMGANIFNMGIITVFVGYGVGMLLLRLFRGNRWALMIAGFLSGWLSVISSAALTSLQLALSGINAAIVFPAMLFVHAWIGIGEGLITFTAIAFICNTRPDLVEALTTYIQPSTPDQASRRRSMRPIPIIGIVLAVTAAFISPLADPNPDGLERIAEDTGFLERAQAAPFNILPDYTIPGIDGAPSTILAGIAGLLIAFTFIYGVALILRGRTFQTESNQSTSPSPYDPYHNAHESSEQ